MRSRKVEEHVRKMLEKEEGEEDETERKDKMG